MSEEAAASVEPSEPANVPAPQVVEPTGLQNVAATDP
jgi:hypothetical protein